MVPEVGLEQLAVGQKVSNFPPKTCPPRQLKDAAIPYTPSSSIPFTFETATPVTPIFH